MQKKEKYESAELKVVSFDTSDIITTSPAEPLGGGSGNSDNYGWTTNSWS